jgi:hypothetical protein
MSDGSARISAFEKVALRCSKYFFDHSKACFTVNWKLAPPAYRRQAGSGIQFTAVSLR